MMFVRIKVFEGSRNMAFYSQLVGAFVSPHISERIGCVEKPFETIDIVAKCRNDYSEKTEVHVSTIYFNLLNSCSNGVRCFPRSYTELYLPHQLYFRNTSTSVSFCFQLLWFEMLLHYKIVFCSRSKYSFCRIFSFCS